MASKTKNILIFGATGLIGTHITNAIVRSKADFGRIAIFTSPNTIETKPEAIKALKAAGVKILTGDITSVDDLNNAFAGIDTIVSCVGRPVIQTQLLIIEQASKHPDIKRIFPSEYGTDIEYDSTSVNEKPHQQKIKVRAALAAVKDLDYTYVVTGPYGDADKGLYLAAQPPKTEARGSYDVKRQRAVVVGDGEGRISLTTMRDVGKLVVAALKHSEPEDLRDRALKVNSFTTTPNAIVAEFERQTGGQQWEVTSTSLAELKRLEERAWAEEDPSAGGVTLRRIWAEGRTLYEGRDNGVIGMEQDVDDLEAAVRQAIEVQTGAS